MTVWNAILLGLAKGLTQFFPVSSTGHLAVMKNLFAISSVEGEHLLFDAMLHLAALISVCLVYWRDLVSMGREGLGFLNLGPLAGSRQRHYPGARLLLMLLLATLPLFFALPLRSQIDKLYSNNWFIGIAFVLSGCVLYVGDRMKPGDKNQNSMTLSDAFLIGLCQLTAVLPGLSRTGVTVTAGLATGLEKKFSVRFSFLLCVPALLGATILSFADSLGAVFYWEDMPAYLLGMAACILSGVTALSLFRSVASRGKLGGFAYYCWVMGVLSVILTTIF